MSTFYYKAYDQLGNKKAGTIGVQSIMDARRELRERGLSAYFLEDLRIVKQVLRRRRKRKKVLLIGGAIVVGAALLFSGLMIGYAGREQDLSVEDYQNAGVLRGGSGNLVASTDQGEAFARRIFDAWQSLAPGVINGIEVRKGFMTLYVSRKVRQVNEDHLEALVTDTARALTREFKSPGANVLVISEDVPMLEVTYNGFSKSTKIKSYN